MEITDKLVYISHMTLSEIMAVSYIDGIDRLYAVSHPKEIVQPTEKLYIVPYKNI